MLLKIIHAFARFLTKLGRKDLRVTRVGDVLFERYYLVFRGRGDRWKSRNVVMHHFFDTFNEDYAHDHGRNCLSIILAGGYTEQREFGKVVRGPGSMCYLRYNEWHNVSNVLPNTWTIWFVGREQKEPDFIGPNGVGIITRAESIKREKHEVSGVRPETPELLVLIDRRRKAVERLNRRALLVNTV